MKITPRKHPAGTWLLPALMAALLTLLVAGCGQTGNASPNSSGTSSTPKSSAATSSQKTSSKGAATGPKAAGPQGGTSPKKHSSGAASKGGRIVVRLEGDPGVKFRGSCAVNGKKDTLSGTVPERLAYSPGKGERLDCEVRKKGGNGVLRVVLKSKNGTSTYQTNAPNGVIRASLTGGSGVVRSVSQTSSVNQSGGSNSVHSSQSVVVNRSGGSTSYSRTTTTSSSR